MPMMVPVAIYRRLKLPPTQKLQWTVTKGHSLAVKPCEPLIVAKELATSLAVSHTSPRWYRRTAVSALPGKRDQIAYGILPKNIEVHDEVVARTARAIRRQWQSGCRSAVLGLWTTGIWFSCHRVDVRRDDPSGVGRFRPCSASKGSTPGRRGYGCPNPRRRPASALAQRQRALPTTGDSPNSPWGSGRISTRAVSAA